MTDPLIVEAQLAARDKEIDRLIKNEQAMLKTIETIQVIRMADEAKIERLTAEAMERDSGPKNKARGLPMERRLESKCDHEMVTTGSGTYCMKPDCDVNWV